MTKFKSCSLAEQKCSITCFAQPLTDLKYFTFTAWVLDNPFRALHFSWSSMGLKKISIKWIIRVLNYRFLISDFISKTGYPIIPTEIKVQPVFMRSLSGGNTSLSREIELNALYVAEARVIMFSVTCCMFGCIFSLWGHLAL